MARKKTRKTKKSSKKKGNKMTQTAKEATTNKSILMRIVLDTARDTHMFCGSEHNVNLEGGEYKKAKDLISGDIIKGEGVVVYIEKV